MFNHWVWSSHINIIEHSSPVGFDAVFAEYVVPSDITRRLDIHG